ncbi:hypothetical protein Vretimale_1620 [Volvox reticuliferus]|uniref:Uncharacterized protein n=1 Tax=Volvox reticuliferus TaxID=1737510 RepID=A0A8J4G3I2_9CHLO|nr:hypothetical protein Vretimale_1620 [Volvox reticuliferus]
MSASTDPLNNAVEELLARTDTLLRSSAGGDRTPSENGRSERNSLRPSLLSRGRGSMSSLHSSTEMDGSEPLLEAAARLRGSLDGASRKLTMLKSRAPGLNGTQGADILQKATQIDIENETLTPRLMHKMGRPPLSFVLTEPISTSTAQSGPTSLNFSLPGGPKDDDRTYNSFGGLQDMVSTIDSFTVPVSPKPLAVTGAAQGSHLNFSTGSTAAIALDTKPPAAKMRSPSRLGSPAMSPRSPLHKSMTGGPTTLSVKPSRRAQLQALLSRDLAQPQDVIKFKAEVKSPIQPAVSVARLAGDLQEKFDRVSRKLKNWDIIESTATERFNAAMDAALEAVFSRVNLAWPSGATAGGASDSSADIPSTSAHNPLPSRTCSRRRFTTNAQREGPEEKDAENSSQWHRQNRYGMACSRRTDDSNNGSPSSSSSQRYAWEDMPSTTTDAEGEGSGGSMQHRGSKARRTRSAGVTRGALSGQRCDSRHGKGRPGTSGMDHDVGNRHASTRIDAERKSQRIHPATDKSSREATGDYHLLYAPAITHFGPNNAQPTTSAHPVIPSQLQTPVSASAPAAGIWPGFPLSNSRALFGHLQPPYAPSLSAHSASIGPGYQLHLAVPTVPTCFNGAQYYNTTAAAIPGMSATVVGSKAAADMQQTANRYQPSVDVPGLFPFASLGSCGLMYNGLGSAINNVHSAKSAAGVNDNSTLVYWREHGPNSPAVSFLAPSALTSKNGPPTVAAPEHSASASTTALHSNWPAPSSHSTVQIPLHMAPESTAGPTTMPAGVDAREVRNDMFPFASRSASGPAMGLAGPAAQGLAYARTREFIGSTSLHGLPQIASGHTVTFNGTAPGGHEQERFAAGQHLQYSAM